MNREWHKHHVMPKPATVDQRKAWHRAHQKHCGCRPIPQSLRRQMREPSRASAPTVIDDYLSTVAASNRLLLQKLRLTIRALVPDAQECISYGLPAFRLRGRIVGGFAARAQGCSYYPFSGRTLQTVSAHIKGYSQTKSALHFGPDKPLPATVVKRLIKARIVEIDSSYHRPRPATTAKPRPG